MTDFDKFFIPSGNCRLDAQLKFTAEIDKMTSVYRKTLLIDRSRAENDAEHSWHIAVMALLFEEYAVEKVNLHHAIEMLIVHDLIEIYAGDTFAYDVEGNKTKALREEKAAQKLFSILPPEQGAHIRALWEEFDSRSTPDARYADCLDKLQPFFHNIMTEGYTWRNAIAGKRTTRSQVAQRMSPLKEFMPEVWQWVEKTMTLAVQRKWLLDQ
ncbi:MAG: HD domain-containing protein [Lentisphaerae bacterium]|nr:HD domain-containing protein [Lentisphaerota bacterium]